jgi:hypothetical protein
VSISAVDVARSSGPTLIRSWTIRSRSASYVPKLFVFRTAIRYAADFPVPDIPVTSTTGTSTGTHGHSGFLRLCVTGACPGRMVEAMTGRLRSSAVALWVGALVGVVVAGGGGRLAMRLIALADDREDFGLSTEGGDTVGEVTLEGTLFVLFTGLVLGTVGAFLYLALRRWLPARPLLRSLSFAVVILGFGLTATVNGNDADFVFVNTVVSILSFATVLLVYGMLVPPLIDRLAPRRASLSRWGRGVAAAVIVVSVVAGAVAVRDAFEIADGSQLVD